MQRNIRVLVVEPNKLPKEEIIPNRLRDKQKIVDGLIEYAYLEEDRDVVIICNEEGKINGSEPNRYIGHDVLFGTFIIVGDNDTGEDRSLTDEQIKKYKERFNEKSIDKTKEVISNILLKNSEIEI